MIFVLCSCQCIATSREPVFGEERRTDNSVAVEAPSVQHHLGLPSGCDVSVPQEHLGYSKHEHDLHIKDTSQAGHSANQTNPYSVSVNFHNHDSNTRQQTISVACTAVAVAFGMGEADSRQ